MSKSPTDLVTNTVPFDTFHFFRCHFRYVSLNCFQKAAYCLDHVIYMHIREDTPYSRLEHARLQNLQATCQATENVYLHTVVMAYSSSHWQDM